MNRMFPVSAVCCMGVFSLAGAAHAEQSVPVVHVDASDTVVVVQRATDGERVCQAPCDRPLEPSMYRLAGEGIRASNDFRVPARAEPIKVAVEAKSSGGFTTGIVLTTLSGVFLAGGFAMLAGASMSNSWSGLGAQLFLGAGGVASLATSLGLGIPGIYLIATNMRSRARVLEGDLRVTASRDLAPRPLSIPIATGTF